MTGENGALNEIVFIPRHNLKARISAPFMFLVGGIFVVLSIFEKDVAEFLFGGSFLSVGLLALFLYPKKIVFGVDSAIVSRTIFPSVKYKYSNFTDIGSTAIRFGRKVIPLTNIENKQELGDIISKLIDDGQIHPSQIQGKLAATEDLTRRTAIISLVPVLVVGLILNFFEITLFPLNGIFLAMLVVCPIVYITLRLQSENDDL